MTTKEDLINEFGKPMNIVTELPDQAVDGTKVWIMSKPGVGRQYERVSGWWVEIGGMNCPYIPAEWVKPPPMIPKEITDEEDYPGAMLDWLAGEG